MSELRVAVVCYSNVNQSMEAHALLTKKGINVMSYGTANNVNLPGRNQPNVYDFSISYEQIYQDLLNKDKHFYTQNGLLPMLDRNRRIKSHPQRFQDSHEIFDVIFTFEERVYDLVLEELHTRSLNVSNPVHMINIPIGDKQEEVSLGALLISEMVTKMAESDDLDKDIDNLIQEFELKFKKRVVYEYTFRQ